jgi:cell division protein FtsI (penicillin-binding protein 3)
MGARPLPRWRLHALMLCLLGGFAAVAWQLAVLGRYPAITSQLMSASEHTQYAQSRPDLVDRNGRMLASDIRVYWLHADPGQIINADETVEKLSRVLPPHEMIGMRGRLTGKSRFEWIKRGLTPKQAKAIHNLGLPGFTLIEEPQRIYPSGRIAAHVLGHTDVDNKGIAGSER